MKANSGSLLRLTLITLLFFAGCKKSGPTPLPTPPPPTVEFAKGADISWITEMESQNIIFYNNNGVQTECMTLLKSLGMNTFRFRVWVNPANNWNNVTDVIAKAVRAKNLGMRIMIDFHYSDSWADPGQQTKPAAWASQDIAALKTSVYNHTYNVLNALKSNGITPEWVQVGNETNDGMLWPEGRASTNMANFAQLVNAGYDAVKAVNASTKVIVHISNGNDNSLFRWIFDGLKNNGAKWDVIGMSLYPNATNWSTMTTQCLSNMNDMIARYDKEVMVVEVGMSWDQPAACQSFLSDIINKTKSIPNKKGLGVLYWEPECFVNWNSYSLGAFDNTPKPTAALSAFN
jgi:arabinogalactan endo-1,4-beta-galactosidase